MRCANKGPTCAARHASLSFSPGEFSIMTRLPKCFCRTRQEGWEFWIRCCGSGSLAAALIRGRLQPGAKGIFDVVTDSQ